MESGTLVGVHTVNSTLREKRNVSYFIDEQAYTAGGVNFSFPANLFTSIPAVQVTTRLKNLSFSVTRLINPTVTSLTTTNCTVRCNLGTLLAILEAGNDDIYISLVAFGS